MFDLSPEKLLLLGVIALVVLGPERLPHLARRAGRLLAELRRASGSFQEEVRNAMAEPRRVLDDAVGEAGLPSIPRVPSVRRAITDTVLGAIDTSSHPPASGEPVSSVDLDGAPPAPDDPTLN